MGLARELVRPSPYWPYSPQPKQAVALSVPHRRELLYGGAAGGGKSDYLLFGASQFADIPGFKGLLLRKTYAELSKASGLIDRSREWFGQIAKWDGDLHRWTFKGGGLIEFGHLQHSQDRTKYQSTEYDFIGFDELTHFTEQDYVYLFSRLRRLATSRIPSQMRAATNPGGRGHRWVKRRFILKEPNPDDPEDTPEKCAARVFIPAKLSDNDAIDQDAYRESLAMLDPETRQQLEDGDWDARQPGNWVFDKDAIDAAEELGRRFDQLREQGEMPVPVGNQIACGVDWGDFATVCEWVWELERGGLYVPPGEIHTSRQDLDEITDQILEGAGTFRYWFAEERYDSSFAQSNRTFAARAEKRLGMHNPIKRMGRPNTYPVAFGEYKLLAIKYLRLLMRRTLDGEKTRVLAISPKNTLLLEQLRDYQEGENGMPLKGSDDAIDALIAGVTPAARANRATLDKKAEEAKRQADRKATLQPLPRQLA